MTDSTESVVPAAEAPTRKRRGLGITSLVLAILAVLGVVLARPIAPKGPAPLTLWQTLCVYAITALLLLSWVIERRPGFLFTFVMSIGLSFSILSVLEIIGDQARGFFSRLAAAFTIKEGSDA